MVGRRSPLLELLLVSYDLNITHDEQIYGFGWRVDGWISRVIGDGAEDG